MTKAVSSVDVTDPVPALGVLLRRGGDGSPQPDGAAGPLRVPQRLRPASRRLGQSRHAAVC